MKHARVYITSAMSAMGYEKHGIGFWHDQERGVQVRMTPRLEDATVWVDDQGYMLKDTLSILAFYRLGEHIVEFGAKFTRHRDAQVAFRSLLTALENLNFNPRSIDWSE